MLKYRDIDRSTAAKELDEGTASVTDDRGLKHLEIIGYHVLSITPIAFESAFQLTLADCLSSNRYVQKVQRDSHSKTIETDCEIPRVTIGLDFTRAILRVPNDCARYSQAQRYRIIDNGVDERSSNPLMLSRHSVTQNDCPTWE